MGQKTNPIGNRLGYIRGWESNWFGGNNFGDYVHFPASEMNNMLDNGTVRFSPLSVNGLDPSLSGGVPYL